MEYHVKMFVPRVNPNLAEVTELIDESLGFTGQTQSSEWGMFNETRTSWNAIIPLSSGMPNPKHLLGTYSDWSGGNGCR